MNRTRWRIACFSVAVLATSCQKAAPPERAPAPPTALSPVPWRVVAATALPEALTNNAVVASEAAGRHRLFSFLGLGPGKDHRAITAKAYSLDLEEGRWERLKDVPGKVGRIAPTAQAMGDRIYVIGGYEVAADGKETSSPAVDIYDLTTATYSRGRGMTTPVDDTVSGVWRDRLLFLVSGWSKDNNVAAVQFYDPAKDEWTQATPITGTPVFGHAGGIVGDVIVYCGGARVQAPKEPKYAPNPECFRGDIGPDDPSKVKWRAIAHHPGPARYRAAAGPIETSGATGVMFVGGTSNPYNINGIGYDGTPSEPEVTTWIYDVNKDAWIEGPRVANPTMDHRGLVSLAGSLWTVGGMSGGQTVSPLVSRFTPPR